jgi:hypothetical protein
LSLIGRKYSAKPEKAKRVPWEYTLHAEQVKIGQRACQVCPLWLSFSVRPPRAEETMVTMADYSYPLMDMPYGQIAGNSAINAIIYRGFEHIGEEDTRKFVKQFRDHPPDGDQIMHTFRELILGAYLNSNGFKARYEYAVNTKTPDWSILDEKLAVSGIVELTTFHIDKATENEIEEQFRAKGLSCVWRDKNNDNIERLYQCIWHKARVYKALLEKLRVPYVISVFPEFKAAIDPDEELRPCLLDKETGLFGLYPEVSGVLHFEGKSEGFVFTYINNPDPLRKIDLPSGIF